MSPSQPPEADEPDSSRGPTAPVSAPGTMLPEFRYEPVFDRARSLKLIVGLLLLAYSVLMLVVVRYPYITISPGSATDVHGLISIDGTPTFEAKGSLVFLTVSLSQRVTLIEALAAYTQSDIELVEEVEYTGDLSREELTRINLASMQQSELLAIKVALDHLGYPVRQLGGGAIVNDVLPDYPAEGKIQVGDLIVAVDGQPVVFKAEAIEAVRKHEPGDSVSITVRRDEEELTVDIRTIRGDKGLPQVGLDLEDTFQYQFPFTVDIDTGQVGGPSAGLAFTLAVIDELTEGELTGGKTVAVTGTIEHDGTVGQVGGVEQKTSAARQSGAVLMIVPKGEAAPARNVAGKMKVVEVENLEDALEALAGIGGDPPLAPPIPTPTSRVP